jgi:type III pantothenate kinase
LISILQEIHKINNLIADIGNSNTKFSCFDRVFFTIEELKQYIEANCDFEPKFKVFIFSTVKNKSGFLKLELEKELQVESIYVFDAQKQKQIKNIYEGMGDDRVAKLIGAQKFYPGKNIILVDFGTATTINIVSKDSEFIGGFIGLGFTSSLRALSDYCDALEDYSHGKFVYENSYRDIEAKDSKKAIINGTINGHMGLVNQWLYKARNILKEKLYLTENTITICTGGDASLFIKYFDCYLYDYELLEACIDELSSKKD